MPENQNLSSLSCGRVEGVAENHQRFGRKGLFPQSQLQLLQEILMGDFETQWESNQSIQFTAPELRWMSADTGDEREQGWRWRSHTIYGFNTGTTRTPVNQVLIVRVRERLKGESLFSLRGGSGVMGVRVRSDSSLWVWDRHLLLLSVAGSDVCGFCCPLGTNKCNYTNGYGTFSGPNEINLIFW